MSSAKQIGRVIHHSVTEYWESPCNKVDPHPQHQTAVSGGGGVAWNFAAPINGEYEVDGGTTVETWCPGVRGLMEV